MSKINLSNWEMVDDAPNDRVVIRSKITGNELELNQSGKLITDDINNANTVTTQDLVVNGTATGVDTINGDDLVTSDAGKDFKVQIDGTDGSGIINFKTS